MAENMQDKPTEPTGSEAAKALSKLGAAKGGEARANCLTPEERSEIARKAVRARWGKAGKLKDTPESDSGGAAIDSPPAKAANPDPSLPHSMFRGKLKIGDMELECHVLNDLRRVLTQREVVRVLSAGRDSGHLAPYLKANPLLVPDLILGKTIQFKVPGTQFLATGYEGTLLVEICDSFMQAQLERKLKGVSALRMGLQAGMIIRACAKVGIIALIDEATGYQKVRDQNALQLKLQAFIADELQDWAKMFPDEFWFELARLESIHYSPRSRPLRWGKYVMMFVYDAIDKDIGKALRKRNPDPHFLQNHHQWLKKFGRDKVHDQIERVVTIMKLCTDMEDFRQKFAHVFKKAPLQMSFNDIGWKS